MPAPFLHNARYHSSDTTDVLFVQRKIFESLCQHIIGGRYRCASGRVGDIGGRLGDIADRLSSIGGRLSSIGGRLCSIGGRLYSIGGRLCIWFRSMLGRLRLTFGVIVLSLIRCRVGLFFSNSNCFFFILAKAHLRCG